MYIKTEGRNHSHAVSILLDAKFGVESIWIVPFISGRLMTEKVINRILKNFYEKLAEVNFKNLFLNI